MQGAAGFSMPKIRNSPNCLLFARRRSAPLSHSYRRLQLVCLAYFNFVFIASYQAAAQFVAGESSVSPFIALVA
jgi:hypothetical protein